MKKIRNLFVVFAVLAILLSNISASAASTQFPPSGLGTLHTYTVWDKIRWGGDCRKLINFTKDNNALSDSYGIVTYGSYFAGAMTSTFGKVGDMMLVVQDNGTVYPVIMADTKNQGDRGCTAWGHQYGKCIVEFEILSSCRKSLYGTSGGYISEQLANPVYKVINLGSVYDSTYYFWSPKQACIDNGLIGYTLLTNPYGGIVIDNPPPVASEPVVKLSKSYYQIPVAETFRALGYIRHLMPTQQFKMLSS